MVPKEQIKDGVILFTCVTSFESQNYEDYGPIRPTRVKVYETQMPAGKILIGYAFNPETGEIDEDTNAMRYVEPKDLFQTREEAIEHYKELVKGKITEIEDDLERWEEELTLSWAKERYHTIQL